VKTTVAVLLLLLVFSSGATVRAATRSDVVIELEHTKDGAVSHVALDGKRVFDSVQHRKLVLFERHPDRTVKRIFMYGKKVYELTWDANGTEIGTSFIVLQDEDRNLPPAVVAPPPTTLPTGTTAAAVRAKILAYEGTPYREGGYDPKTGFKTAGLIWHFYRSFGLEVPQLLQDQATGGKFVPKNDLVPGDVLVFSTRSDKSPNIVGLYAGNDEMVYMSFGNKKARRIEIDTPYWTKAYTGSRRYFGVSPSGTVPTPTKPTARPTVVVVQPTAGTGPTRLPLPTTQVYQQGEASFYGGGDGFNGTPTASGETFDHNQMTAAHRTLPFNTRVKVVRTDTGQSCVVRINDRGPFIRGRIIDLSWAAAKKLDMVSKGVAKVNLYLER